MKRVHARVTGRVQGVGFRASTAHQARRLGVDGWVRNLPDGAVEISAAGDDAAVDALLVWLGHGPPGARVRHLDVENLSYLAPEKISPGFEIR